MSAINKDPMISLRDYLKKPAGKNGPGLKVYEMAEAEGIVSELRKVNGKDVETVRVYPQSFLTSIDSFLSPYKA